VTASVQQMLDELEDREGELTDWERRFVARVSGLMESMGSTRRLSGEQVEKIEQIYRQRILGDTR